MTEKERHLIIDSRDPEQIRDALKERVRQMIKSMYGKSLPEMLKIVDEIKSINHRIEQYVRERNC